MVTGEILREWERDSYTSTREEDVRRPVERLKDGEKGIPVHDTYVLCNIVIWFTNVYCKVKWKSVL